MQDWPLTPGRYPYRPLKRGTSGWDVYGLQKLLIAADFDLPRWGADGSFGAETEDAVKRYQKFANLTADGIAGVLTDAALCKRVIAFRSGRLPTGLARGQIESESSFWPGNYTEEYPDGKRDLGLAMRHLAATQANKVVAFDGPSCIAFYGDYVRDRHVRYWEDGENKFVATQQRAWELAAGSWNAPAWTDRLAAGGLLTPEQEDHLNGYIERVTVYVTDWNVA